MSDIRAYFGSKGSGKSKKSKEDSKSLKRGHKRVIDDDEETEDLENRSIPKNNSKDNDDELREVDASEYFGKKKRISKSVTPKASKKIKISSQIENEIVDLDDDNDDTKKEKDSDFEEYEKPISKMNSKKGSKSPIKKRQSSPKKPTTSGGTTRDASLTATETTSTSKKVLKKSSYSSSSSSSSSSVPSTSGITAEDILAKIPDAVLPDVDPSKKFNFAELKANQASVPQASGTTDIPEASPNCLAGMVFVFTGILPTLSRELGQDIVKKYGGKVTTAPSRNTTVVVLGSEAGPKKIETIKKNHIKAIDEDGFFQLLREMPVDGGSGQAAKKAMEKKALEQIKIEETAKEMAEEMAREDAKRAASTSQAEKNADNRGGGPLPVRSQDLLWTTKYAPSSLNHICGNKSAIDKLTKWLSNWKKNAKQHFKIPGPDGSGIYRAAILHGPPGIGKTTAAHLIAKLQGYDVIESNASDTRSKTLLQSNVSQTLSNTSLLGFATSGNQTSHDINNEHSHDVCIVMDEVDGMSAGDRGGVGAMASLCRTTNIPIILVCNERSLPKMRPFDRVTLDIPFRRPDASAIRSRIMSIAHREGLKINASVIDQLVQSTRSDIRQIINILSTYSVTNKIMDFDDSKTISKSWEKHTILKPFDIVGRFLSGATFAPSNKISLNEKIELYFHDHDFAPLMVQENYLHVLPSKASSTNGGHLELAARAAESIADGDLVDRMIHSSEQQWSLMPLHAVLSSVRPSYFVSGQGQGRYGFTSYLGQRSKAGKYSRLLQELHSHMRMKISGDADELRMQYLPLLTKKLLNPLVEHSVQGIDEVIGIMDEYFITKEDWDVIMELNLGSVEQKAKSLPTATKSAFTRKYNAADHPVPFIRSGLSIEPKAKKSPLPDLDDVIEDDVDRADDEDPIKEEEEEEVDITKDKYIKVPKAKGKGKAKATSKAPSKSRTKAKGKA